MLWSVFGVLVGIALSMGVAAIADPGTDDPVADVTISVPSASASPERTPEPTTPDDPTRTPSPIERPSSPTPRPTSATTAPSPSDDDGDDEHDGDDGDDQDDHDDEDD